MLSWLKIPPKNIFPPTCHKYNFTHTKHLPLGRGFIISFDTRIAFLIDSNIAEQMYYAWSHLGLFFVSFFLFWSRLGEQDLEISFWSPLGLVSLLWVSFWSLLGLTWETISVSFGLLWVLQMTRPKRDQTRPRWDDPNETVKTRKRPKGDLFETKRRPTYDHLCEKREGGGVLARLLGVTYGV
jgi:hypothetical protein